MDTRPLWEQVVEVCGCSREAAQRAVEAAGPGGIEMAVDFVLSTMSSGEPLPDVGRGPVLEEPGPGGDLKLVCLVRKDLQMGVGKIASQVAHAAIAAARDVLEPVLLEWEESGECIIVLAVEDEAELHRLLQTAEASGLQTQVMADAGRTEVEPNTITVGAIGPAPADAIDRVTGHLALLQ